MTLSFRDAGPADIPSLCELAGRIWRAYYPGIISLAQVEYMLPRMFAPDELERQMAAGIRWELAEIEGCAVAFLSTTWDPVAQRVELNKLYLVPELHGRGHGQAMLNHVLEAAAAAGAIEVHLRVNKGNRRAIAAYERAGFRVRQSLVKDIGGGFVMDDFVMSRAVPAF